jgi:hypothetical protein
MRKQALLRVSLISACTFFAALTLHAQSSIQVFSPVNVRPSASGTGYGSSAVAFNSATLNLSCPAGAVPTATLSSTADGTGNVLVDNLIQLSVTTSSGTTTPVNVCQGGTSDNTPDGTTQQDCFTTAYQTPASAGTLNGMNPDTLTANGGVAPINISSNLPSGGGSFQLNINLVDEGGWLASSTIYLNTSCSQGSVTGPAQISGNPISNTSPTLAQLTQTFGFNTLTGQQIQLVYDLSQAQTANTLTITNTPIPQGGDMPIDQATFQSMYEPGTSFATSSCLIHTGETLNNAPACKLFTVECTTGTGSSASGAQCPVSSLPNEVLQDVFDGPAFTLPDISTPSGGPTFHEGIGFLMANEGWTGGPCTFDAAANLQDLLCPQNLLAYFSGPGLYDATGHVSHPNSTFIPIYGVPEDLTSVTVTTTGPAGTPVPQQPGGWINNSTANVTLSSQPPVLTGTSLPGVGAFVPSPIQTITYGISAANSVPTPMNPPALPATPDTTVTNDVACPTSSSPTSPAAAVFATPAQVLTGLADGSYLLHYFAQDCAGTEELQFTQTAGVWATNYYTFPINVDTIAPVASTPTLPPTTTGSYTVGQSVMASYSCTDERSGVVKCGASTFPYTENLLNTGTLTSPVDTSSPGMKTFTVTAVDAAGNQSSASVTYNVVQGFDSAIKVTLSPSTVTYPLGSNVVISVVSAGKKAATGTVTLEDGSTVIASSQLGGGAAYLYIQKLNVGAHILTAVYSGDASNPAGTSAPVTLTVKPVPVQMTASCWNLNYPYGVNFQCGVYTSSAAGPPQGVVTYQYDGGAAVSLPLQGGVAQFTITKPVVGNHTIAIGYAAQTNYAAATPVTVKFVVTPAPVIVLLTPSSWYLTGGNLTLSVSISSWSAGPPNQLGTVTFYDGSKVLATVPVTATGTASTTLAASSLANGSHSLKAVYSGSTNYASGTATAVITVAVK